MVTIPPFSHLRCCFFRLLACLMVLQSTALGADENDFYRLISVFTPAAQTESRAKSWKPAPEGLVLEVSGIAALDDRRVAVAIRKGEIWILDGVYDDPPSDVTYRRFA